MNIRSRWLMGFTLFSKLSFGVLQRYFFSCLSKRITTPTLLLTSAVFLQACSDPLPLSAERYAASDALLNKVSANLDKHPEWHKVAEIDHSRLGKKAGSTMPPARVIIFSNPQLETNLIQYNPLVAIDLPLRLLAYEETPGGDSKLIYNRFNYIQSRYNLGERPLLKAAYEQTMTELLQGIDKNSLASFSTSSMEEDGIITIDSPFDFETTLIKISQAIASQDDTVSFGQVDFKHQAEKLGIELLPNTLILFGGPAPGAKAMNKAPTLGLDAFCQKFLVWQDASGKVHLSFNDLLAMAERQDVPKSIPLRVINFRLNKVFSEALSP